jgi:tripartite-type tricarboxylate transporter receptor subunit TctC
MRNRFWTAVAVSCVTLMAAPMIVPAAAQQFPVKSVRLIVPFPPGGSTETLARITGMKLAEVWGQQVVIDNRPGAGGIIGTELGAKAVPDGYTLLMGSGAPLTIVPGLYAKLPYDPLKDFAPIVHVAAVPNVIASHPSVPARNVRELVALARAQPGQLTFSSNGAGAPGHLAGELLNAMSGTKMLHVPYKGAAPATLAVLTGEVSLTITTTTSVLPQAKAGRMRILGVTTLQRIAQLPETPTVAESGLPGYEAISWFGLVAPAAINPDLLKKISADALQVVKTRDMQEKLAIHGATLIAGPPELLRAQIRDDLAKWVKIIKQVGIKAE